MKVTSNWLLQAKYAIFLMLNEENELSFHYCDVLSLDLDYSFDNDLSNNLTLDNDDISVRLDTAIRYILRFNVRKQNDIIQYCEIVENWFIAQLLKDKVVTTSDLKQLLWTMRLSS